MQVKALASVWFSTVNAAHVHNLACFKWAGLCTIELCSSLLYLVGMSGGYNAQRTPMQLPLPQKVSAAISTTVNYDVIQVPSLGGSLPLYLFEQKLGAKPITVPVVNYDNNQHAENENIILQYLWEGVETFAAIMGMK